jgi:hypothetical protein
VRWFALLSLALLGTSVWLAPRVRASRPPGPPDSHFYDTDPRERIRRAEAKGMLGAQLVGWEELTTKDPEDMEALRGRIRVAMRLGAVAISQPGIDEVIRAQVTDYLRHRARLDPSGDFLQEVLGEWVRLRLDHPYWHAQAAVAIYLAGRNDPRGPAKFAEYWSKAKFYGEFFRYSRRYHPPFNAVRPVIEHYLEGGNLSGRVQAGTTLLDYYWLFGEGKDLLDHYRKDIRDALFEAVTPVPSEFDDAEIGNRSAVAILGLAMLRDPDATEKLSRIRELDAPAYIGTLRIARIWAGLEAFSWVRIGSEKWKLLESDSREYYFRAAAHNYAWLKRDPAPRDEAERSARRVREQELLLLLEDALRSPDDYTRVLGLQTLVALSEEHARTLPARIVQGGGLDAIFATLMLPPEIDRVPALLPALALPFPNYAALAAVSLLRLPQ